MKRWYAAAISNAACELIAFGLTGVSTHAASDAPYDLIVCDDVGSPAHAIGVGLELLVKLELLPTTGVDVASSTSSIGEKCLVKMKDKAPALAIMNSTIVETAPEGSRSSGDVSKVRPLLIAALWREFAHFVIARNHLLSGTIGDLALLPADQLMIDPALCNGASQLLAKAGITIDRRADRRLAPPEALLESFDRGTMIGLAVLEPIPSPTVTEFLAKTEGRATMLELSERYVLADGKGWQPLRVPAAIYPNIDRSIETFGNMVMLTASSGVPDEAVYQITKIMFDSLPKLAQLHDVAAQITIDRALADADLPLHRGAARYYREIGVLPHEAGGSKIDQAKHREPRPASRAAMPKSRNR